MRTLARPLIDRRLSRRSLLGWTGAAAAAALGGSRWDAHAHVLGQTATGDNPFGPAEQQGGTYSVAGVGSGSPRIFVPTSYYGTTAFFVCKLLYTPLVMLDRDWQNLGPALATEWAWSPDNLQLTMRLRDGVTFHDGEPFTAEDVVFTYKLMVRADPFPAVQDITIFQGGAEYKAGTSETLTGVEAVDDHTVRFNLTAPSSTFLLNLSNCGILPAHAFAADALGAGQAIDELPFFTFEGGQPIGTGPWQVKDYNPETNLSLDAFPAYYKGKPILDSLILRLGVTGPAGIAGLQAGEFDGLFVGANFLDTQSVKDSPQHEIITNYSMANEQNLLIATEKPYLDVKARQALVTAIDVQTLIDTVTFGLAKPAPSIMMHPSLFPNPNLPAYPFSIERAKQLLAESSWEPERTLKFGRFIAQGAPDNVVVALMNMWQAIGVKVEFTPLDPATQVEISEAADHVYDVVLSSFAWLAYDSSSAYASFACERRPNYSNYCNPEFDAATKEAIRTLDPARATALYQRAQVILQTELPYAPIWIEPEIWAIQKGMHGGMLGRGPLNDVLSELWWKA